jgi:hypothetical protein
MRDPVSRSRPVLWLAVFDRPLVGALRLEREFAFGVAHRLVGRPDVAGALVARGPGLQFEAAHLLRGQRGLGEGVVLAARQQTPEQTRELAGRWRSSGRGARGRADSRRRSGRAGGRSTSTPRPVRGGRCLSPAWRCGRGWRAQRLIGGPAGPGRGRRSALGDPGTGRMSPTAAMNVAATTTFTPGTVISRLTSGHDSASAAISLSTSAISESRKQTRRTAESTVSRSQSASCCSANQARPLTPNRSDAGGRSLRQRINTA